MVLFFVIQSCTLRLTLTGFLSFSEDNADINVEVMRQRYYYYNLRSI